MGPHSDNVRKASLPQVQGTVRRNWLTRRSCLLTCCCGAVCRYDNDKLDKIIANQSIPDMARRHAFMVRWVPSALYRALQHYQAIACGDDELDGTSQQPGAAATNGGPAPIQQVNNDAAEVERLSRASRAMGVKSRGRPLFGTQRQKTVKAEGL